MGLDLSSILRVCFVLCVDTPVINLLKETLTEQRETSFAVIAANIALLLVRCSGIVHYAVSSSWQLLQ